MNKTELALLSTIGGGNDLNATAYNIRKDGKGIERKINEYVNIESKEEGKGINIYVKENTPFAIVDIPVLITESGLTDVVYNDFFIGKNATVTIVAGCGINNPHHKDSRHDGIHRSFIEDNASVTYIEKHYGEGVGSGKRILNPTTEVTLHDNAFMTMETSQIKGVDDTHRVTKATLSAGSTLIINEKIFTSNSQKATTSFDIEFNGDNSSSHVISRSVAEMDSYQEFNSNMTGNSLCYGHVECDAIIKDNGTVKSIPQIYAKNVDASLVHEATIGKIAGEQFIKLMSLGLSASEAEQTIIKGFLK